MSFDRECFCNKIWYFYEFIITVIVLAEFDCTYFSFTFKTPAKQKYSQFITLDALSSNVRNF